LSNTRVTLPILTSLRQLALFHYVIALLQFAVAGVCRCRFPFLEQCHGRPLNLGHRHLFRLSVFITNGSQLAQNLIEIPKME
jgi:hypothetical protein